MKFVHHSNFCELANGLWSLYIYKDYSVKLGKTDTDDDIIVFAPNSNEASLIDFVAGIRREARRFQNSIDLLISNQNRIIYGNKFITRLAKRISWICGEAFLNWNWRSTCVVIYLLTAQ
ncbi:MAG: hypothetical protein ACLR0U_17590 [Enterocloster clostridioformis]